MKKRRRGNCCSWRPLCFLAFKTCWGGDFGRQLKRSQQKAEKGPLWLTAVDLTSGKRYEIKEFSIVCGAEKSGRCRRSILFVYWLILDLSISEAYGSLLFFSSSCDRNSRRRNSSGWWIGRPKKRKKGASICRSVTGYYICFPRSSQSFD